MTYLRENLRDLFGKLGEVQPPVSGGNKRKTSDEKEKKAFFAAVEKAQFSESGQIEVEEKPKKEKAEL